MTIGNETYQVSQDNTAVVAPYTPHAVVSDSRLTLFVLAFDESCLDASKDIVHTFF